MDGRMALVNVGEGCRWVALNQAAKPLVFHQYLGHPSWYHLWWIVSENVDLDLHQLQNHLTRRFGTQCLIEKKVFRKKIQQQN